MTWSMIPTTSTESPFSDILLMFHTTALNNCRNGVLWTSMGATLRKDLAAAYCSLIIKVGEFSIDGANIMIDNGWLEKPFLTTDRRDLAKG